MGDLGTVKTKTGPDRVSVNVDPSGKIKKVLSWDTGPRTAHGPFNKTNETREERRSYPGRGKESRCEKQKSSGTVTTG